MSTLLWHATVYMEKSEKQKNLLDHPRAENQTHMQSKIKSSALLTKLKLKQDLHKTNTM